MPRFEGAGAGTSGSGRVFGRLGGNVSLGQGLSLDRRLLGHFANVLVQLEELIAGRAVDIGPPVFGRHSKMQTVSCVGRKCVIFSQKKVANESPLASKVLLVEEGSVGAQEGVLDALTFRQEGANVEHLTTGFDIGVITCIAPAERVPERKDTFKRIK